MMHVWRAVLCLVALVVLAGCDVFPSLGVVCVPGSLYPMAASESDLVYDPGLLGEWRDAKTVEPKTGEQSVITEPAGKWFFEEGKEPKTYRIGRVYGEEDHSTWVARLVKNGDALFLDAVPDPDSNEATGNEAGAYRLGLHISVRVKLEEGKLEIATLDPQWYLLQLERKQFPLRIEHLGGGLPVITSPPEEIRAFYAKVAADPAAFADSIELVRPKTPAKRP